MVVVVVVVDAVVSVVVVVAREVSWALGYFDQETIHQLEQMLGQKLERLLVTWAAAVAKCVFSRYYTVGAPFVV